MNVSPPIGDIGIDISSKSKDSTNDLFEFRASENDVIHENDGGSNQSIYSAEEVNPEADPVFEHATVQSASSFGGREHQERSASLETEIRITHRNNMERSQSLGDETNTRPVSLIVRTTNQFQCVERNGNRCEYDESTIDDNQQSTARIRTNITNNNSPLINNNQSPNFVDNSSTLATTTTTIILTTNSRINRNLQNDQPPQPQLPITETPPRWIPDEEAAQCTSKSSEPTGLISLFRSGLTSPNKHFLFLLFDSYFLRHVMLTNIHNFPTTSSLPLLWWCILRNMLKFTGTSTKIWTH